ncbi:MAG: GAF domain-containing protein [Chloroflexota bacterium]|nr:GAF domain-containing protein [Chloroflexota bacterium]
MTENTTTTNSSIMQVTDYELASMRHSLNLLKTQIQAGRVDGVSLSKHVEKLIDLLARLEIEHKQLKKQERLEQLYKVSRLLGSSLDVQVVLDQVMDAIILLTGAERGFLMLRNDDGAEEVKAARNLDQQTLSGDKFKYSRTVINKVLDMGESIVTTNAAEDPRFAGQASIVSQALRGIMASPMRVRGKVIGAIYVDNRATAGLFEEDDLSALELFAGQAAITLENAQLFRATDQKLAQRVEELSQLRRIDMQLNETLDMDRAVNETLEWACRLSHADRGHIGLVEGAHIRTLRHYGINPEDTQPIFLDLNYAQALDAAAKRQTILINDPVRKQGIMFVPIMRETIVLAVMVLRRNAGTFTDDQVDLVERVASRAAIAIENARLYAAVQAADRAKSEFVGIVAHDMKVPMASILGYADLTLMDGDLQEQHMRYLNRIRDTVKRMEVLVSDLADISRIESGHFSMNETRVSVEGIVRDLRESMMTQVKAREHNYTEQVEANLPVLRTDYYRLLQVLTNLVSNAVKYTPKGGTVTVSARRLTDEHGVVRVGFGVQDSGIGLSSEAMRKLGTKFWRAEDEFTRSQPGTGLGFAITRSLVEQMGSRIEIESEVGKGSKFMFSVAAYTDTMPTDKYDESAPPRRW